MPETARVLSIGLRRASASLRDFSCCTEGYVNDLADLIRRSLWSARNVDRTNSSTLRSYQLRNTQPLPDDRFRFRRAPIGVAVGDVDFASFLKGSRTRSNPDPRFLGSRAADSSHLGYLRIPVSRGDHPSDLLQRWQNGEPHYKPQAEWTPSPFGRAALQGRPPVRIAVHHGGGRFATQIMKQPQQAPFGRTLPDKEYRKALSDAEGLVGLLRHNRYLQSALAEHPDSDIWLSGCSVGYHEAEVVANAFNRTTHFSTGITQTLDSVDVFDAARDNSILPFSVTEEVLRDFDSSLRNAPDALRDVAMVRGWSATAVYVEAGSLTGVVAPPISTCTPK